MKTKKDYEKLFDESQMITAEQSAQIPTDQDMILDASLEITTMLYEAISLLVYGRANMDAENDIAVRPYKTVYEGKNPVYCYVIDFWKLNKAWLCNFSRQAGQDADARTVAGIIQRELMRPQSIGLPKFPVTNKGPAVKTEIFTAPTLSEEDFKSIDYGAAFGIPIEPKKPKRGR